MPNKLLFVGGVSASDKTELAQTFARLLQREPRWQTGGVKIFRIATALLGLLELKDELTNREALPDYKWRECEQEAVEMIIADFQKARPELSIINCHFAIASAGGFLPGLRVSSLKRIARAILDVQSPPPAVLAAVVLLEAPLEQIIERRRHPQPAEERMTPSPIATAQLINDLEWNRNYALFYYQTLVDVLGADRVLHVPITHHLASTTGRDAARRLTANEMFTLLKEEGFFGA